MPHRRHFGAGASACLLVLLDAPAGAQTPVFTEQSAAAGIDAPQISCCYPFASHLVAGGAVADFDRDGFQDLYIVTGGNQTDRLYMNNGDGTFTDHAAGAGLGGPQFSSAVAVGDYNADGWIDIYVTSFGSPSHGWSTGRHRLWRNNGDGTFTDVAQAAGVHATSAFIGDGFGAAFGDYDLDGDLDLAVAGWITSSGGNRLFRNNGAGAFTDVTMTALPSMQAVRGFSPRFTDTDGDRYPELLWVGDYFTSRYLRNNTDGTFTDLTATAGVGLDSNGMGNATGDFNNDGLIDWYVSSILEDGHPFRFGNMLYMNQGGHVFTETGASAGVADGGWGWGTLAADVNHDGLLDIVETNGWPEGEEWVGESGRLYINNGNGTFSDHASGAGFDHTGQGRGLVNLDYDNDGDQDLAVFTSRDRAFLYRNDLSGPATNWLRLFFDTSDHPDLAPDGFGVRVQVTTGTLIQTRFMDGGSTYLAVPELSTHFGLAGVTHADLTIEWPNGRTNRLAQVAANQTLTIRPCFIDGDANGDAVVDFVDLNEVLTFWGQTVAPWSDGDTDGNGAVDFDDINAVLAAWADTCPQP